MDKPGLGHRGGRLIALGVAALAFCAVAVSAQPTPTARPENDKSVPGEPFFTETGPASWYGSKHDGKTTADGSSFDPDELTAAHPTLKFGTIVQVTNLANRRTVKVEITDRGPHTRGRVIDLSEAAAREIGMMRRGTARVRVRAYWFDQFPD